MTKIIQTRVDAKGDVHLDFSGFVGRDCETEEDRLRHELNALGLNINVSLKPKSRSSQNPVGIRSDFLHIKSL